MTDVGPPSRFQRWVEVWRARLRLAVDRLRAWKLRYRGASVGPKVGLGPRVRVDRPWGVELGERVRIEQDVHLKLVADEAILHVGSHSYVGPGSHFDVQQEIYLGSNVLLGPGCVLVDHDHGLAPGQAIAGQPCLALPIRIGDGAWLGAHATVLKGVEIGEGSVVGAGSVVRQHVPRGAIVAGVPARVVGHRSTHEGCESGPSAS